MAYAVQWWLFAAGGTRRLGRSSYAARSATAAGRRGRRDAPEQPAPASRLTAARRRRRTRTRCLTGALGGNTPERDPTHRGLRPHRRPADRRAGRQGRLHRLAVPAPLRLGGLLRRAARRRGQRPLADRPQGRGRLHPARLRAATPSSWRPCGRPATGTVKVIDFMPQRDRGPRRRTHRRGRQRPVDDERHAAAALRLRLRRAVDAPRRTATGWPSPGPDSVWLRSEPRGQDLGPGLQHPLGVHGRRGREGGVRPHLAPLARAAARRSSTRTRRWSSSLDGLGRVVGALPLRGPVPGRRASAP